MTRKIKKNIYGNWSGYIGRNKIVEFGGDEVSAGYWFLTGLIDFYAGYQSQWKEKCEKACYGA